MRKDFRKISRLVVVVISSIGLSTSILAYKLPETEGHYKLLPINHIYINNVEQHIPENMGMAYTDNKWRTQVPLRFISEKLGHKIDWVESSNEIKIDNGKITLKIDNPYALVNENEVLMDSEPFIDENRAYVPLRFISETLGYTVEYTVEGVQSYIHIQENTTK